MSAFNLPSAHTHAGWLRERGGKKICRETTKDSDMWRKRERRLKKTEDKNRGETSQKIEKMVASSCQGGMCWRSRINGKSGAQRGDGRASVDMKRNRNETTRGGEVRRNVHQMSDKVRWRIGAQQSSAPAAERERERERERESNQAGAEIRDSPPSPRFIFRSVLVSGRIWFIWHQSLHITKVTAYFFWRLKNTLMQRAWPLHIMSCCMWSVLKCNMASDSQHTQWKVTPHETSYRLSLFYCTVKNSVKWLMGMGIQFASEAW